MQFLSPTAQALVRYVRSLETSQAREFPVPQILLAMKKQSFSIDKTLVAIDECCKASG